MAARPNQKNFLKVERGAFVARALALATGNGMPGGIPLPVLLDKRVDLDVYMKIFTR